MAAGNRNNDNPKDSADLLRELENLQRVLDDASGETVEFGSEIPVLEPITDDIPVLSDLFNDEIPVLKSVNKSRAAKPQPEPKPPQQQAKPQSPAKSFPSGVIPPEKIADVIAHQEQSRPAPESTIDSLLDPVATEATVPPAPVVSKQSTNPFLPQAVLDRLQTERIAAQQSAEEAQHTMQRVMEKKLQNARQTLHEAGVKLSADQREALIEELVTEMLPQIAQRLKDKLRQSLK